MALNTSAGTVMSFAIIAKNVIDTTRNAVLFTLVPVP